MRITHGDELLDDELSRSLRPIAIVSGSEACTIQVLGTWVVFRWRSCQCRCVIDAALCLWLILPVLFLGVMNSLTRTKRNETCPAVCTTSQHRPRRRRHPLPLLVFGLLALRASTLSGFSDGLPRLVLTLRPPLRRSSESWPSSVQNPTSDTAKTTS